ncbi:MAG: dUTP diphosphatase, partial [Monoglobaceae bacterium]
IQIPEGWGAFVFPRSGLSFKKGITMANCVGVIDTDYTGEVKVSAINLSDKDYTINPGDRVAQLVFLPVEKARFIQAESLDDTERGAGGFGSTGK